MDADKPVPRNPSKQPLVRDLGNEKKRFRGSVLQDDPNYGYVALAIGQWVASRGFPKYPPQWALDECRALFERASLQLRPVISGKSGPRVVEGDEIALEKIADILIDWEIRRAAGIKDKPSLRSVIKHVLGKEGDNESSIRRIQRLWALDQKHRRVRAISRQFEKLKKRGLLGPPE